MSKFIELLNGDLIHPEAIRAIRLGDPRPKNESLLQCELKARVIVDLEIGDHFNCIVLDFETVEERNKAAEELKARLKNE